MIKKEEAAWNDPEKVSLIVEDTTFRVKKDFLMKQSSYFEAMFSCDMTEAREGVATINETRADIFEKIILYYDGHSLNLTEKNAFVILTTASMYQFKKAMEECVNFLCQVLSPSNCLKIMAVSHSHNIKDLTISSLQFALWEFDSVCQQQKFLELNTVQMLEYLDNVHLNTTCEMNVLKAVMRWLEKQEKVDVEEVEKILQTVRFQSIPKEDLETVLDLPLWADKGCTDVIRSFHSPGWLAFHPAKVERRVPWVVCATGGYHGFRDEEGDHYIKNPHAPNSNISAFDLNSLRPNAAVAADPVALAGLPMIDPSDKISYLWGAQNISIGGYVYLFGGEVKTNTQQKWNLDVWRYCIFDQKWSKIATLQSPRRHHALAVFGDDIYLCGGFGRHRIVQASVDCFNIKTYQWTSLPEMENSKHNPVACFHKNRLYVISTSIESWAPGENSWSGVDVDLPYQYGVLALVSFKERLFLFTKHHAGVFELFLETELMTHLHLASLIDCPLSACVHAGEVWLVGGKRTNYVSKVKFLGEVVEEEIVGKVSRIYMEHSLCMLPLYPRNP